MTSRPGASRVNARSAAGAAFVVIALALAAKAVWHLRADLVVGWEHLTIWPVLGSLALATLAVATMLASWREVLRSLDVALPMRPAALVFFVGQLGKYLPGSVWTLVAQVELARKHGIPAARMLAAGLLAILVSTVVGGAVACALLPFVSPSAVETFWWVPLCIPMLLVWLYPPVLMNSLNLALRLVRRQPLDVAPSTKGLLRAAAWALVTWLLLGLHAYVLVAALGTTGGSALAAALAATTLAISAGVLVVPAPAGAGVRELAYVLALAPVLPPAPALLVALMSRVVLIVVDVGYAGAALAARQTARGLG